MRSKLLLRAFLVALATAATALLGTGAHAADAGQGQPVSAATAAKDRAPAKGVGITAEQLKNMQSGTVLAASAPSAPEPPPGGWEVPSDRAYHLTASCQPHAGAIAQGAAAWAGLNETGNEDTPVECRDTYIDDCGGGGNIVGCNWGQGQRIALYMGGVSDQALLSAHEFGHDWYGHSGYQCASWDSPEHVMAPTMCNFGNPGGKSSVRID